MEFRSDYFFLPFPYLSKSSYKKYKDCPFYFKTTVIDGFKTLANRVMARGTTLHYLYYKFFDYIDFEKLWDMNWNDNHDTIYSQVYMYFYNALLVQIPSKADNIPFLMNLKAFARMEENHYHYLRVHYTAKHEIRKYFMPGAKSLEKFVRNDEYKFFGTFDRISVEEGKTVIIDYKTGKIPPKLLSEKRTGVYTKHLPSYYTPEGNFYVMLYLLHLGYDFKEDEKGKLHFYKNGAKYPNIIKTIDYAFAFTGSKSKGLADYRIGRKKAHITSIRNIFKTAVEIRSNREWPRTKNLFDCKRCDIFATKCEGEIPIEIYRDVFGGESAPQDVIQRLEERRAKSSRVD